jgi:hypothetical protein
MNGGIGIRLGCSNAVVNPYQNRSVKRLMAAFDPGIVWVALPADHWRLS